MFSTSYQMIPKKNSDYFVTKIISPLEQVIFPRGRAAHQKRLMVHVDNCSVHGSRASTSWLKEHGMCLIPHQPCSSDLAPTNSICFLQWKKNSKEFRYVRKTSFWVLARDVRVLITTNWIRFSGLSVTSSRSKPRYWRLPQIINIFHIYWFVLISLDVAGADTFRSDDIWTMHISIIRGNLVNVSKDFMPVKFGIQPTSRTWLKWHFSLSIWKQDLRDLWSRVGKN
jgi:hypothetical protein